MKPTNNNVETKQMAARGVHRLQRRTGVARKTHACPCVGIGRRQVFSSYVTSRLFSISVLLCAALLVYTSPPAAAQFTQQGSGLIGTGTVGSSYQGSGVGISPDGNTLVVGGFQDNSGAGATWVFTRSGGVWTQLGSKLVGTGATG